MAERRMFARTIVLSDSFLDMPMSARCLYFTLGMVADDDGFVNSPKSIMRQIGATDDDMKILIGKKYVLCFDDGLIVIKHWRINNYLRKDRYVPSKFTAERNTLRIRENGAYTRDETDKTAVGIPAVYQGEERTGKNRIDKYNIYPPIRQITYDIFDTHARENVDLGHYIGIYLKTAAEREVVRPVEYIENIISADKKNGRLWVNTDKPCDREDLAAWAEMMFRFICKGGENDDARA